MSPNWPGFMQLRIILQYPARAALWGQVSFSRIKLGFPQSVRPSPTCHPPAAKVGGGGRAVGPWSTGSLIQASAEGKGSQLSFKHDSSFCTGIWKFLREWKVMGEVRGEGRESWPVRGPGGDRTGRGSGGGTRKRRRRETKSKGRWTEAGACTAQPHWQGPRMGHTIYVQPCFSSPFVFFHKGFLQNFILFWPSLWHVEIPRPGIEPTQQQWPKSQQWQCRTLSPLHHRGTPKNCKILSIKSLISSHKSSMIENNTNLT